MVTGQRTSWELSEIPADMRQYFEEYESVCGAPWERITDRAKVGQDRPYHNTGGRHPRREVSSGTMDVSDKTGLGWFYDTTTLGWRPTCDHYPRTADWREIPARVKGESDEVYQERIAPVVALRHELIALWEPHIKDNVPCVVCDPFGGSGTTAVVADRLGRDAILIDLNPEYSAMQRKRVVQDAPMFANVEAS